jgi:hypothetical protein
MTYIIDQQVREAWNTVLWVNFFGISLSLQDLWFIIFSS